MKKQIKVSEFFQKHFQACEKSEMLELEQVFLSVGRKVKGTLSSFDH